MRNSEPLDSLVRDQNPLMSEEGMTRGSGVGQN